MTPDQLAEIEARANAATPGPWEWDFPNYGGITADSPLVERRGFHFSLGPDSSCVVCSSPFGGQGGAHLPGKGDAEFIAHARTDVPALIAEVHRLREENETIRAVFEELVDAIDDEGSKRFLPGWGERIAVALGDAEWKLRYPEFAIREQGEPE